MRNDDIIHITIDHTLSPPEPCYVTIGGVSHRIESVIAEGATFNLKLLPMESRHPEIIQPV